jgi:structural maintenance of chromosome 4
MLDHIVVQTTAGTQKCLEFLRKNNLGRASFVPLEKMKKGAHDRVVETPENAPRLFDLITPANFQIAPALFLAVGNTLVAPDLETATRWAYEYGKRWRVVTLDGKLIESSGTMSGGGNSVSKGKMKLSVSSNVNVYEFLNFLPRMHLTSSFTSHYRMERKELPTWIPCPKLLSKIARSLNRKPLQLKRS